MEYLLDSDSLLDKSVSSSDLISLSSIYYPGEFSPLAGVGQVSPFHLKAVNFGKVLLWPHALAGANHSYRQWAQPLPKKAYLQGSRVSTVIGSGPSLCLNRHTYKAAGGCSLTSYPGPFSTNNCQNKRHLTALTLWIVNYLPYWESCHTFKYKTRQCLLLVWIC